MMEESSRARKKVDEEKSNPKISLCTDLWVAFFFFFYLLAWCACALTSQQVKKKNKAIKV